jgi:hypothetical protein
VHVTSEGKPHLPFMVFPKNTMPVLSTTAIKSHSQLTTSLPRARMPDHSSGNGDLKEKKKKRAVFLFPGTLSTQLPTPAFPSGCYWQPGNHIFLVPDIIIIINIGYLSHSLVSRNSKLFTFIILSSVTWGRGREEVCLLIEEDYLANGETEAVSKKRG